MSFNIHFGMPDYEVINGDYPLTIVLIGEQLDVNRLKINSMFCNSHKSRRV